MDNDGYYYIDYVFEEEKQFATIENNKISISEDAINGDQVVLFVQMKRNYFHQLEN